ncbi:hypothetical protein Sj15T_39410 [Sphingobium sp. TA15]|uniref:Uncharacterized protein n=2 Tax=Sphingomonadaceae TaxID=41297 RepID=D4Z718_SPHIU|nr:hypothetical protein SJA_C2-05130 [Sphingobium indicum UT26S]BDD68920.1 hypothetical protein Sj15T_39410 [Sphingobium sp. TA15]
MGCLEITGLNGTARRPPPGDTARQGATGFPLTAFHEATQPDSIHSGIPTRCVMCIYTFCNVNHVPPRSCQGAEKPWAGRIGDAQQGGDQNRPAAARHIDSSQGTVFRKF